MPYWHDVTPSSLHFTAAILLLFVINNSSLAADIPFEFNNPTQAQRYKDLLEELRCLVCQNQSLADSHADLAQDLRNEVYAQIQLGKDDKDIIQFLVARYGDFVLYRPPFNSLTSLLWIGPFLLLLIAAASVFFMIGKRQKHLASDTTLSDEDKARAERILKEKAP